MSRFANTKMGIGLLAILMLARAAAGFNFTTGLLIVAAGALGVFAVSVFQSLTK